MSPAPIQDLDTRKHAWVGYIDKATGSPGILIERDEWENDSIRLNPAQALSLLAWLKQEETTLRALAKEECQEGQEEGEANENK